MLYSLVLSIRARRSEKKKLLLKNHWFWSKNHVDGSVDGYFFGFDEFIRLYHKCRIVNLRNNLLYKN